MKNRDEKKNYFIKEINQNELMRKKHKNVCRALNYIEHLLILVSTVTRSVSISPFSSLFGIAISITSSAKGLKIFVITGGIKNYKQIIKKKNNKA